VDAEEGGAIVTITPLEGPTQRGTLEALQSTGAVVTTPAGVQDLPWGSLREIHFEEEAGPAEAGSAPLAAAPTVRVHLLAGEVLVGTFAGGGEEGFTLDTGAAGKIVLSFETIRSLVHVPAGAGPCFEPEARTRPGDGEDVLYLENGDSYGGLLLEIDERGFALEDARGASRRIPWEGARVLHLDNQVTGKAAAARIEIGTRDGARWLVHDRADLSLEDGRIVFALLSAPKTRVSLPLSSVQAIRPSGTDFVYASDLPFESVFETPYGETPTSELETRFLDTWFGARVDRRPSGCPLRLAGTVYRHGFAVHARSRITIPLDGAYRRFLGLFGVDDEALAVKKGGIVDARILGDDKVLWTASDVRAGEAPRSVGPLDVEGVKILVLEVDFGKALHVRDRATWADPILIP